MQTGTGFSGAVDFASFNSLDFGANLFGPTDAGLIRDTNLGTIKAFNGKKTIQMVVAANNNRQIDWDNSIVSGGQVKNVNSSPTEAEILAVPAFNVGNVFNIATDRLSIADIEINTNEFNPNDVIFFHLTTEST